MKRNIERTNLNGWKYPAEEKPPQGKKILCLHKGDVYVAQRMGDYYFSIPFYDSQFSRYFKPDMWKDIDLPHGLTGRNFIKVEEMLMNFDELESLHPEIFKVLMEGQKEIFDTSGGSGNVGIR